MASVFQPEIAREIVEALSEVEARKPGRQFIYTVSTQSEAPDISVVDHSGLLRTYADDAVTIATDAGDREIGWYEITAISAAPDYS